MTDYLRHLRADADAVLAIVERGDLSSPVAACPGWTLRQLVEHLGGVHRWATAIVRSGQAQQLGEGPLGDLWPWFAEGADGLLTALSGVDPAAPCWSFTSERTYGFWVRRQALETAVHRWDTERAVGEPGRIDPSLAADGVAEVVELLAPRQVRLERIPPLTAALELQAVDTGGRWVLGEGPVSGSVTGPAELLLLLLWHRVDPGDPRVGVEGSAGDVLRLALAP